ncbi:hypothetical protein [Methylobacterium sp. E-046]|uniref:hypothetical protein n=1 Tax=Methylobacterium sp. E-046 TaxID=2836576 RepID=UPI001FB86EF9|nr:hypothetical protein [Methylobacterium sp. E-046]
MRVTDGHIENFVSFEREVVRRIGRPAVSAAGRYEPAVTSNDVLTEALRRLAIFEHA